MSKKSFVLQLLCLAAILGLAFLFMLQASRSESAIMDELAHIPAGYSYVKFLDYRLNPEHPPIIKALSALPLLFQKLNFPLQSKTWTEDVNSQWDAGTKFLYESGNDADQIIQTARFFPIILTLLTILLIYVWSREILGNWWSLLPAFLFGLSPTALAHGHYVTTDIGATFGFVLTIYLFSKFILAPSRKNLIWAGLGLGLAELLKFSLVLVIPYFFLVILIAAWAEHWHKFLERLRDYFLILIIAYAVVYAIYFLFTFNYPMEKQISDTQSILTSFSPSWLANIDITLVKNNLTRPLGHYLLGVLMTLQRSAGGNTGYFLGEVSAAGSPWYFPTVFGLKETIPALILIALGTFLGLKNTLKKIKKSFAATKNNFRDYLGTHFTEFSMLVFVVIYWAYSIKSPLNIGFRHILPTLPFVYILLSSSLKTWSSSAFKKLLKPTLVLALLFWALAETAFAAPYFLSYFNELGGGIWNGYHYVTDSNYDWGQDLKRLQAFVENPPAGGNIRKIAVDYFGGGNPEYYLGDAEENWWSAKGNPSTSSGQVPIEWLAVSVNTLEGAMAKLAPGQPRNPEDEYSWLKAVKPTGRGLGDVPEPDYRVGTSIFIYKF